MTKKIFSVILAITLILFTSSVFATNNEMGDSMNKATNTVRNVVGGAENVVENTAGVIGTGVKNLGNTFIDRGTTNDNHTATGTTNNDNMSSGNNDNYVATRTATTRGITTGTDNTILGMSSTVWTWFVLAIATIAIVGLVWYYAMQHQNTYDENNN